MNEHDDPQWRERIDSVILYDKLEEVKAQLKDLERAVRGGRDSLLSEYRRHDQELTRIHAVLFQDPTGQKGLLHDVDVLMGRRSYDNTRKEFRWKYWIPTVLAVVALAATTLTNLDKIKANLPKYHPGPLEKRIDQAKHPRGKKIYRTRVTKSPPQEPGPSSSLPSPAPTATGQK
jgi:hypothetical protein